MRAPSRSLFALMLAATLLVVSCSDSSTGPSNPEVPDLASLLDQMSLSTVGGTATASAEVAGAALGGPRVAPDACAFAEGWFVCPTVTVNGLTFTRKFQLKNAAGQVQSRPDRSTASIQTVATAKGTLTVTRPGIGTNTHSLDRSEDMTLSGIQAKNPTLNGIAHSITSSMVESPNGTLQSHTESTETTRNLVLPNRRAGERWPLGGTVTVEAVTTVSPNGQQRFTSELKVQFAYNGTKWVTVTMTTAFGTSVCKIDMESPAAVFCGRP